MKSLILLLLSYMIILPAGAADIRELLPPGQPVAGHSQAEWSQMWWEWAASFPREDSPVADRTGQKCYLKQSGPVWFLAGTYGTHRTIRHCTIPHGKYLFFPLINYVVFPTPGVEASTCESVMLTAQRMTDGAKRLVVDVDGARNTRLQAHRQATPGCFDLWARVDSGARLYPAAANGYYVMLSPLKPGRYKLNFGGILPNGAQAVTYTLIVK